MNPKEKIMNALFFSTFPPRKCGIGTFTKDLVESIDEGLENKFKTKILAVNEPECDYDYDEKVWDSIGAYDYEKYISLAEKINSNAEIKIVSIQHEFGIFGGEQSCHPVPFLDKLKKPSLITFHSVFPNPQEEVKQLVNSISKRVSKIIVMTDTGVRLLRQDYGVNTPIEVIPHGIPNVSFETQNFYKQLLNLEGKIVLTSFGMVGPGKGYEQVIESLPQVVKRFPNLIYLIIGATHPGVIEEEGENYRISLIRRINELGLGENVKFYDKYATLQEIIEFLKATDIYMSTSQNPEQITSGTLVYAMGCGRSVISTPFPHAKDIVKEDNGILVDYESVELFEKAIFNLVQDQQKRKAMERNNYDLTRKMIWKNVARDYTKLFSDLTQSSSQPSELHLHQSHTFSKAPETSQNEEFF
jgi:glycosyltransferase involved in cell wall biosynthesis